MINDIGTIKSVVPSTAPTGTVRAIERTAPADRASEASGGTRAAGQPPDDAQPLEEVVSDLNNLVHELHRELQFSVDHESGDTVVKVVDRETDEVVRQIPSEEVVRLRKRLQEAAGVIFQDSA